MKWILLATVCLTGAAMLVQVPWRRIDPDELEHIHAACAVSWGEIPYRDFFEHHGPAFYYLLQPILRLVGPELPALWWSRLLMWGAAAATLAVTGAIAHRLAGKTAAVAAPALLACTTIFFQKAVEVRPDVPAMLLLALAAYVEVARGNRRSAPTALLIGLLLGLATLFTQKAIVPAAALIFSQWMVSLGRARLLPSHKKCGSAGASPSPFRNALLGLAAVAATWLAAAGLFWTAGGAVAFLDATICQLWRWPLRQNPLEALRPTLSADLTLWIAAAAAIVVAILKFSRCKSESGRRKNDVANSREPTAPGASPIDSEFSQISPGAVGSRLFSDDDRPRVNSPFPNVDGTVLLSLTVLICFVGGLLIKAAYAQYYLLWLPLAAVVAADWLVRWADNVRLPRLTLFGILAALFVAESLLATRAIRLGADGPLPHLTRCFSALSIALLAVAILAAIAAAAGACIWRGRQAGAILSLALLGLGYAGLRNFDALCWSNQGQVAMLERVCRLVGPQETVFDGYTGLGALRRHAYYYWWLNPYSLRMMGPAAQGEELLASLKRSPPKLVCLDENIRSLPPPVLAWIEQNYRAIEPPLYVRRTGYQPVQ